MQYDWKKFGLRLLSYVLVAAVASAVTFFLVAGLPSKLSQLEGLLEDKYIGEFDKTKVEDAAAYAMIQAMGDRWSYYVPAKDYAAHQEDKENRYVGIGVTITVRSGGNLDILQVEPDGPAKEGGVLPGDILTHIDGNAVAPLGSNGARDLIRGEEGTRVRLTVLRQEQSLELTVVRKTIQVAVATGEMLPGNVGLVTIRNFNSNCFSQTKAAVENLRSQGAKALVFDVRNNPGGYLDELIDLLDYLLPEGVLFRSVDYTGKEEIFRSDASCVELPMAVLINSESYSAAEFFAAALEECGRGVTVGQATTGKSYFQSVFRLLDGSAVAISIGKYFTPEGRSLADEGGLKPNVPIAVDDETGALIYARVLKPAEDPQIQAALAALQG